MAARLGERRTRVLRLAGEIQVWSGGRWHQIGGRPAWARRSRARHVEPAWRLRGPLRPLFIACGRIASRPVPAVSLRRAPGIPASLASVLATSVPPATTTRTGDRPGVIRRIERAGILDRIQPRFGHVNRAKLGKGARGRVGRPDRSWIAVLIGIKRLGVFVTFGPAPGPACAAAILGRAEGVAAPGPRDSAPRVGIGQAARRTAAAWQAPGRVSAFPAWRVAAVGVVCQVPQAACLA
jgi:hypothetical protein